MSLVLPGGSFEEVDELDVTDAGQREKAAKKDKKDKKDKRERKAADAAEVGKETKGEPPASVVPSALEALAAAAKPSFLMNSEEELLKQSQMSERASALVQKSAGAFGDPATSSDVSASLVRLCRIFLFVLQRILTACFLPAPVLQTFLSALATKTTAEAAAHAANLADKSKRKTDSAGMDSTRAAPSQRIPCVSCRSH